jgi:hypothetical protein
LYWRRQTFTTAHITQLTKCAGQSGNIQIYYHEELPIQIKMLTGTLGSLSVYIKSHELIEQLEEEPDETEDPEDDDAVAGSQFDVASSSGQVATAKISIEDEEDGDEAGETEDGTEAEADGETEEAASEEDPDGTVENEEEQDA